MTADDLPPFPEIPLTPEQKLRWLAWGRECMAKGMDGWKLVPVEPTPEMIEAVYDAEMDIYWGYAADGRPGGPEDVYRTMIAAIRSELPRNQEG